MVPGKRTTVRVQLNDIAYAVDPGYRLRVAISTTYWPMVFPAPEPVLLTVFVGASLLDLPTRPTRPQDRAMTPFPPVEMAPGVAREVLEPGVSSRTIERDVLTGTTTLKVQEDVGRYRMTRIGLEVGYWTGEELSIRDDDPLSARTVMWRTTEYDRPGWRVRTAARATVTATRDEFLVKGELDAYDGDERIAEKRWDVRIPRDLV
jgi:hypothetical protein